jgi:twitching motility protein PilJ
MSANSGAARKGASLQTWLILFLLAAIVLAGADFFLLNRHDGQDRAAAQLTTQIQVNSQQVANFALQAANGNIDAFKELASTRAAIAAAVQHLNEGDSATGLPAYGDAIGVREPMAALSRSWNQLNADLGKIEANKDAVLDSASQAATFNQQMPDLNSKITQVINILQSRGSASSIYTASQLMVSGDRLIRRVGDVLQGGADSASAANGLALDSTNYGETLKQLAASSSGEADRILVDVQKSWAGLEAPVQKVIAAAPTLVTVKNAATQASVDSQDVLLKANSVSNALGKLPQTRPFPNVWWGLLGALAAASRWSRTKCSDWPNARPAPPSASKRWCRRFSRIRSRR